jgi:hypothetical protein
VGEQPLRDFFRPAGDGMAVTGPGCFIRMGGRSMLHSASPCRRLLVACACAAVTAAGCTMCPSPYDYSGPVPNGSAPQNDFRARSNGILPLDAAPKPFPPIVKKAPQPTPAAEPKVEKPLVAEAEDDVLRLSAETPVPEADTDEAAVIVGEVEQATTPAGDVAADSAGQEVVDETEPPPAAPVTIASDSTTDREPGAATEPRLEPVPVAAEPALRETPGWRTRR